MSESFSVSYEYPVIYCDDALGTGGNVLTDLIDSSSTRRAVVFVDHGLHVADGSITHRIEKTLGDRLAGPPSALGGESMKGLGVVERCAGILDKAGIDRHSYVIAIGGGAMLDVVGFAAAITHRGVRLIRVPTTVLAQNDAGIGVKNGVNLFGKKNFLGTFAPPFAVINDFSLLQTLRPEQWRDGIAEAIKVGLVRDELFFEWIEENIVDLQQPGHEAFRYLIRRCAELHLQHITTSGDPFERGSARPLDFGHWSAHKIESLTEFRISHGHAVAIGMAIDMTYARRVGICTTAVAERVIGCIRALRFPLDVEVDPSDLLGGLREFQEHLGGNLSLSMVIEPGRRVEIDAVKMDEMRASIGEICTP